MSKIEYPVFLSKIAKGEDTLEGKSQDKLADVINNLIKEDKLEKKVIGLEGEWGSGKSNVIRIIENKLGSNYHIFIFDAWGSQEDITRKSFLEQLIQQLFDEKILKDPKKWKALNNNLLSNTTTTHTQKFPQIKPHWLILTLSILLFGILSSLYDNVFKDYNILAENNIGFLKPILFIYLIPIPIFIWGICLAIKEYKDKVKENNKKEEIGKDTTWEIIGKMFYWFNGNDIDSVEIQRAMSEEPSVKQFREYLKQIELEIKESKKLVIVFDNLDRLDKEKVTALWSSIHTFFAEDYKSFESWVIIPYDHEKLKVHLGNQNDGFISKTFSLNFRITPPVVTQWEAFLKANFKTAFGEKLVDEIEMDYVVKLFDFITSQKTIKPREIINYINNLVVLYKQWTDDLKSGDLKFRYIALFVLTKDKIISSPNESILNREYLGSAASLFTDDSNLDTCMSMLTFGVNKKLADEVLLDRQFKIALREGKPEIIKEALNHTAFQTYFFKAYNKVDLQEKYRNLIKIFDVIKDSFSAHTMQNLWKNFGKDLLYVEEQFNYFNANHQEIIVNTDKKIAEDIIKKLVRKLTENFDIVDVQIKYFNELKKIEEFIKSKSLNIDIFSLLQEVEIDADAFLQFLELVKEDYEKYKISTDKEVIVNEFYPVNNVLEVEKAFKYIDTLAILRHEYNFKNISKDINTLLMSLTYEQKEELSKYITILKKLGEKPLKIVLSNAFYAQLSPSNFVEDEIYEDALCIAISNFQLAHDHSSNFQTTLNSLTDDQIFRISSKLETYISYEKLLKLIAENAIAEKFINLKKIAHRITLENHEISKLDVNWIIKDFEILALKVFDNQEDKLKDFLDLINIFHTDFTNEVKDISTDFFPMLKFQDLQIIKSITKKSLEFLKSLTKEQYFKSFKNEDDSFKLLKELVKNNLINSFTDAFYSAYDDYMKDIALEIETVPDNVFWDKIMTVLNSNKLKTTFTSIRDIYINDRGEAKQKELYFFEKGLIAYGNLSSKPEVSTLKIIIPLIKYDNTFEVFLENYKDFTDVLNSSSENKESAIGELQLRFNSEPYKNDERMMKVAEILKLKSNNSNSK